MRRQPAPLPLRIPSPRARSTASLRDETLSFRYTAIACVLTVFREMSRRNAISRNERWLARSGTSRSSAGVSSPAHVPSSERPASRSRRRRLERSATIPRLGCLTRISSISSHSSRARAAFARPSCRRASSRRAYVASHGNVEPSFGITSDARSAASSAAVVLPVASATRPTAAWTIPLDKSVSRCP